MAGWWSPTNFDANKKYPVVFFVYTEPAGQNAKDQFGAGSNRQYKGSMANDGYIYITIDNRGTPAPKGREWRKSIYRKIGQLNIRDQALAAKEVLKWKYVDTSRVAVWGWSGGGSATLSNRSGHKLLSSIQQMECGSKNYFGELRSINYSFRKTT